jgi:hypothetical protein
MPPSEHECQFVLERHCAQGAFFIGVMVVADICIGDEVLVDYGDECVA